MTNDSYVWIPTAAGMTSHAYPPVVEFCNTHPSESEEQFGIPSIGHM